MKWLRRDADGLKAFGEVVGSNSLGAGDAGSVKGIDAGRQAGNEACRLTV